MCCISNSKSKHTRSRASAAGFDPFNKIIQPYPQFEFKIQIELTLSTSISWITHPYPHPYLITSVPYAIKGQPCKMWKGRKKVIFSGITKSGGYGLALYALPIFYLSLLYSCVEIVSVLMCYFLCDLRKVKWFVKDCTKKFS